MTYDDIAPLILIFGIIGSILIYTTMHVYHYLSSTTSNIIIIIIVTCLIGILLYKYFFGYTMHNDAESMTSLPPYTMHNGAESLRPLPPDVLGFTIIDKIIHPIIEYVNPECIKGNKWLNKPHTEGNKRLNKHRSKLNERQIITDGMDHDDIYE